MTKKYIFGNPFETEAVIEKLEVQRTMPVLERASVDCKNSFCFSYVLNDNDVIYGLGEANRGMNKRGYVYESYCFDDPNHTEDKISLYGAHNFLIISGEENIGFFFDYPAKIRFDIGYTKIDELKVTCDRSDLYLYIIEGNSAYDVAKQFRAVIGKSYIPPKFAFGYGQSRWGYKTSEDIKKVVDGYRNNNIPLDMVYMDIDYMQDYKDFTVNPERFPDFSEFVKQMRAKDIHLVPIIDAGVKIEEGYEVYEEGVKNQYFCKREDGTDFAACVWPGWTHFPDVLNPEARAWFGEKYKILIEQGIDGFWNDMNEPAIFYSKEGVQEVQDAMIEFVNTINDTSVNKVHREDIMDNANVLPHKVRELMDHLQNSPKDYALFYHNVNGKKVRHDLVHNLYGYNMTRAAKEGFEKVAPGKEILLFSRSSYIGMHRYGGIWTGDNQSWWSHILLNLQMLPSLNMCGFLYVGADLGGFGSNTTRDLLLRWLALGVFTPLMRNHAALGTREQECYQFENIEDFRHIIGVRYRLLPYLYDTFVRCANEDDMFFKPLGFEFPQDKYAVATQDQLLLGNELMIVPVYTQNAIGRTVYLPEEMMFVKFKPDGDIEQTIMDKGYHFIDVALNEVPMFIRKGKKITIVDPAASSEKIDMGTAKTIGY